MVKTWSEGETLNKLREHLRGSTQKELAAKIGVTEPFLSKVLNGKTPVSQKIAEWVLECHLTVENKRSFRKIA